MTDQSVNQLPQLPLPAQPTDSLVISRDGVNLLQTSVSEFFSSDLASLFDLIDAGNYFTTKNVEAALQQIGAAGGGGTVASVTAANATVTIGGTVVNPTVARAAITGDVAISAASNTATLATVATPGTSTKVTFNAKGLITSGASAALASSDFANQGTATTVLHGSASGNPSWGAVNLATDVTGSLPSGSVSGLGTMSVQNATAVAITGGTINGTVIGGTTPVAGTFTTLNSASINTSTGTYSTPSAPLNLFLINQVSSASAGGQHATNTRVYSNVGGTSYTGDFENFDTTMFISANTGNTPPGGNYQAFNAEIDIVGNDGGTSSSILSGNAYAGGVLLHLRSGATFWGQGLAWEIDLAVDTGASVGVLGGCAVIVSGANAVAPFNDAYGFLVGLGSGTPTLQTAYQIGGYSGLNPLASTASVMQYMPHGGSGAGPTIANGIHLNTFGGFTGNAFDSPNGFAVDGSANIKAVSYQGTTTSAAIVLGDALAHNVIEVIPEPSTNGVRIQGTGIDVNQNMFILSAGTGSVQIGTVTNGVGLRVAAGAGGGTLGNTNFGLFTGTAGGSNTMFWGTDGVDPNVSAIGQTKGTGVWIFTPGTDGPAFAVENAARSTSYFSVNTSGSGLLGFAGASTTTAPSAGAGAAPPATPAVYGTIQFNGVSRQIALY